MKLILRQKKSWRLARIFGQIRKIVFAGAKTISLAIGFFS